MTTVNLSTVQNLNRLINTFYSDNDYELECKFKKINKSHFDKSIQFLIAGNLEHKEFDEVLDISTDSLRITIFGIDDISNYCNNNNIKNIINKEIINKKSNSQRITISNFDVNIDLKKETKINDLQDIKIIEKPNLFRLKKRITFYSKENEWKYDLTIVKSSENLKDIKDKNETYEIEMELIKTNNKKQVEFAKKYFNAIFQLYVAIKNYPISDEEKKTIKDNLSQLAKIKRNNFIGPKPVTLEKKHLVKPNIGVISVQDKYTVTEKADGERMILYVNEYGKVYLINSGWEIIFTGISLDKNTNTIIDGEWVTKSINNKYIELYAMFDCYYYNKENISNLPFISIEKDKRSRLSYLNEFCNSHKNNFNFTLYMKQFRYGDNIFLQCSELLMNEFPYHIDGLIFTPMYFSVGGYFLDDNYDLNSKTWNYNLKWKPENENTIDFLVKFSNISNINVNGVPTETQIVNLYVGDNNLKYITSKYWIDTSIGIILKRFYDVNLIEKLFVPGDCIDNPEVSQSYIKRINSKIYTREGTKIENNSIVEFSFDDKNSNGWKWIPIRNRDVKTDIYKNTKHINNTANFWDVALSIWKSIKDPVTKQMITGNFKSENINIDGSEDIYYYNSLPRDKIASIKMKLYHNYIKRKLIKLFESNNRSIIDIACGKAGDLDKWSDAKFYKIFGIDNSKDNIEKANDSAYSRTIKHINKNINNNNNKTNTTWLYMVLDASKKINNEYNDKNFDKDVFDHIYGLIDKNNSILNENYWGYCKDKFDIVSCQFAIHYFFKSEIILDNFIYNVDEHLKPGGYFIGTCLDGSLIKDLLKNIPINQSIEGKKNDRIIWQITKKYSSNTDYGQTIGIYMDSINQFIDEYIVNFEILKLKCKKYNIQVIKKTEAKQLQIDDGITNFKKYYEDYKKKHEPLDDIEEKWSFLNTSFIFKKKKL